MIEVNGPAVVRQYRPTITFSSAVMLPNSRMFWKVRAMPARTTLPGFGGRTAPSKTTWPAVGRYIPVRQLKNVVLPAPLGPIRPMISPRATRKFTESTAVRPPNRMVTFSADRIVSPAAAEAAPGTRVGHAHRVASRIPPVSSSSSWTRSTSSSSSSWNSSCRRWLATRPSGRNRIMMISSSPNSSSR